MTIALNFKRIRAEARGVLLTLGLVGLATLGVFGMVRATGMQHGSAIYLVPVQKAMHYRALAKRGLDSIFEGLSTPEK